jgi:ribose transport system ATP-binding protein
VTNAAAELLTVQALSKRFTGTLALDSVDFTVRRGEIHALLGENGAGKSTLIKLLAGVYPADSGSFLWQGRQVDPTADRLPIAFIHQDLGLVDTMTVAENVALVSGYPRRHGLISWRAAQRAAAAALDAMGGNIDPLARVANLPAAERSIVAIARALAVKADLLVLDEPTAALPEADVARLLDVLRRLRTAGLGIVYVTHRLDEVFRMADRVTVLRDGRRVAVRAVAETTPAALVHDIVGRSLTELFVKTPHETAGVVLDLQALTTEGVGPVSFTLRAGEILGLVGLRGAGHHTVGRALFGDAAIDGGGVTLAGEPLHARSPVQAMRRRVGFVSSKRSEESVAPNLTVRENLFMNPASVGRRVLDFLAARAEQAKCMTQLRRFSVRPSEPERPMQTLSGGNQQKVIVARWMVARSRLLVLEEPTFGVDVGSKAEIYQLLQAALDEGLAVLLISSDFEEVAGICNRALVFDRGRVVAEVPRESLTIPRLTALAAGAAEHEVRVA